MPTDSQSQHCQKTDALVFILHDVFRRCLEAAGGRYPYMVEHDFGSWLELARWVTIFGMSPEAFIKAQFAALLDTNERRLLTPKQLVKSRDATLDRYYRYLPEQAAESTAGRNADLSIQLDFLANQISRLVPSPYPSVIELLLDPNGPFEAWFRVSVAYPLNPRIRECFWDLAITQVHEDLWLARLLEDDDVRRRLPGAAALLDGARQTVPAGTADSPGPR